MTKARIEAFSDGVLAVIITIMVLELKVPHGDDLHALGALGPIFAAYALSFIYVGIYWGNHHHLMQTVRRATGGIMWANLHLLFWLSLFPLMTAWAGHFPSSPWPTTLYGVVLLLAGLAWLILQRAIIASGSALGEAIGSDWKGWASAALYTTGSLLSFVRPWIAQTIYGVVAAIWLVPDRRIERWVHSNAGAPASDEGHGEHR
jgi:uncharacterized membrane protein